MALLVKNLNSVPVRFDLLRVLQSHASQAGMRLQPQEQKFSSVFEVAGRAIDWYVKSEQLFDGDTGLLSEQKTLLHLQFVSEPDLEPDLEHGLVKRKRHVDCLLRQLLDITNGETDAEV
jgi:hypothetical protein